MLQARRALISVYDKRGLAELARGLEALGIEILSTGGTYAFLEAEGVRLLRVSEVTGLPELLGGRVKTLHPKIHGGILADRARAGHLTELNEHGITPIDLVVVNLYPFEETVRTEGAGLEAALEMIDIGGPTMLRGAAKNFRGVVPVVDPHDYPQVLAALEEGDGVVPEKLRRRLAIKAFRHTQAYDAAIASWLERQSGDPSQGFGEHLLVDLRKVLETRYGENPHQRGALYQALGSRAALGGMEQLQGKALSFNNLLDAEAARRMVAFFDQPVVAIVKHGNPCGVGTGADLAEAWQRALACDPDSAFGSVVAVNRAGGGALARAIGKHFVEVLVAPEVTEGGLRAFAVRKRMRLLRCAPWAPAEGEPELRAVDGGFLAQTPDAARDDPAEWTCASRRRPSESELEALAFAWTVVRFVRSNAIVVAGPEATFGIGAGQMSRVDSCRLAVAKAGERARGAAAASDAFFPFRDGLDALAEAGVSAVVQPGRSRRDREVIEAADEHGLALMMTGVRHFLH